MHFYPIHFCKGGEIDRQIKRQRERDIDRQIDRSREKENKGKKVVVTIRYMEEFGKEKNYRATEQKLRIEPKGFIQAQVMVYGIDKEIHMP